MVKLVDARDSKSRIRKGVGVQFPPPAPTKINYTERQRKVDRGATKARMRETFRQDNRIEQDFLTTEALSHGEE